MQDLAAEDPPRPPGSEPPGAPSICPTPAPSRSVTGRSLTLANWIKAMLLGIALHVVLLFGLLVLGLGVGPSWLGAWLVGALVACYLLSLRSIKPYLAVAGGMLIPIVAIDLIVGYFLLIYALMDSTSISVGSSASFVWPPDG